jgi:hypothetical protein
MIKGLAAGFVAAAMWLGAAPAEVHDAAWVSERVREWQPTKLDRSWESIGWASSLSEALRLGREHGRPIFLFTHDGRLNVGRC